MADLAPAPSLYPPTECQNDDNTGTVQGLVIVAVICMVILHILGSLRRLSSHSFLHAIVMGVDTLSYPLVSYAIGSMRKSEWYYNDFVLWAVFLLLLLGSTDSLTVCRLGDIDNWKSIYVKHLVKGFFLVYIIYRFGQPKLYLYPFYCILLVVVLKGHVRIASMRMVSKKYLGKNVKVIADYMQEQKDNRVAVPFDPVTMQGYRYIVAGEKYCSKPRQPGCIPRYKQGDCLKQVTTVEKIWQCTGKLLLLDRGQRLKDLCLSMALSKMLNRRFAGFRLAEAELQETHDFVFKGLLAGDKPHHRAFRVIEEELVFVHDLYYTRYSYLYQKGRYFILCLPVIMIGLCVWLTCQLIEPAREGYIGRETVFITVVVAVMEVYQLYLYTASGWFKVALIRSYATTQFLPRCRPLEIIIGLILRFMKPFRPWKRTLGQYCILRDLGNKGRVRKCIHRATSFRLLNKAKKGQKKSVKLSENVKKAVVDSLLGSNGDLTNGLASLQKNGVHGHLSWACDTTATDGAVTRTILIWHIATTICYHQLDKQAKKVVGDMVETASTLSQYCMHLLAFAPNLLPDHSSISESILDQAINEEADQLLKGAMDWRSRCEKLIKFDLCKAAKGMKIEKERCQILMKSIAHDCVADETRLVARGVRLAMRLLEDIQEPTLRWKVLADFWAEMMLYVSPSDNAREHLETLAKGGEFITHLWTLLTHAGVLKRGSTGSNNVV